MGIKGARLIQEALECGLEFRANCGNGSGVLEGKERTSLVAEGGKERRFKGEPTQKQRWKGYY
ncbi:hypothetical protein I79_009007 [Cricetulus griseus]|uniref:Uncharacterized protein n=1 Tax=Cricetulus griseus TaxID=10029 RepID=G3HEM0_CRIGR|nr:hypothetical protein I79_009007 [Cricetulus griseus]